MKPISSIISAIALSLGISASAATAPEVIKFDNGPEISIYKPSEPNGAAVLICPGGGNQKKCIEKE